MNRWLLVTAALLTALVVAVGTGVALSQVVDNTRGGQPVALKSATPGALELAGVHLTSAALPPECGLPVRLPGCPVARSTAEAAATKVLGTPARTQVRETVLAQVDLSQQAGFARSIHGLQWVVAIDRTQQVGVMMCGHPMPAAVPAMAKPPLPCGLGRYLVFVDPTSAAPTLTISRP